ncbi:MAG TPA: DUF488 domain-containing protein [Nitrospira sp.]
MSSSIFWTIGHSTRPIDAFLDLLQTHTVELLVDVRKIPRSRRHPQFNMDSLAHSLKKAGLEYVHKPGLGGLRKATRDSINTGWRNASFRGYADYMQTEEFQQSLNELIADGRHRRTAIMCAEAVPWRCHRSLISDALTVRDWTVRHIMSDRSPHTHILTSFAVVDHGRLTYPEQNRSPRLF